MTPPPRNTELKIGAILIRNGYIQPKDLQDALAHQRRVGGRIGELLVQQDRITQDQLDLALAEQFELPRMELTEEMIQEHLWELAPLEHWRNLQACPVMEVSGEIIVALAQPADPESCRELEAALGQRVRWALGDARTVDRLLERRQARTGRGGETGSVPVVEEWLVSLVEDDAWGLILTEGSTRRSLERLDRRGEHPLEPPPEAWAWLMNLWPSPVENQETWARWTVANLAGRNLLLRRAGLELASERRLRLHWLVPPPELLPPTEIRAVLDEGTASGGLLVVAGFHPIETERLLRWAAGGLAVPPILLSAAPSFPGTTQPTSRTGPEATGTDRGILRFLTEPGSPPVAVGEGRLQGEEEQRALRLLLLRGGRAMIGLTAPRPSRLRILLKNLLPDPSIPVGYLFGAIPRRSCSEGPGGEVLAVRGWRRGSPPTDSAWNTEIDRLRKEGLLTELDGAALAVPEGGEP